VLRKAGAASEASRTSPKSSKESISSTALSHQSQIKPPHENPQTRFDNSSDFRVFSIFVWALLVWVMLSWFRKSRVVFIGLLPIMMRGSLLVLGAPILIIYLLIVIALIQKIRVRKRNSGGGSRI